MKGKSLVAIAVILTLAALIFAACNKQNPDGTGLYVYVTDGNGNTVLDANGQPKTEEWKTSVVYATNADGETYTNSSGEKVTVKQTRPVVTVYVEESYAVLDSNGETKLVPKTTTIVEEVTDKEGEKVTQPVTDKEGDNVLDADGQVVTEVVTEIRTEKVTHAVQIDPNGNVTSYNPTKPKTTKTTSIYENPLYDPPETKKPTKPASTGPKEEKNNAANDWIKPIDASANDTVTKVRTINSKSYIVLGCTESKDGMFASFGKTGLYSYVSKYNADGGLVWTCPVGYKGHTKLHDIAILKDGSMIAVGELAVGSKLEEAEIEECKKTLGFTPDSVYEAIIAKISADGQLLWIKNYGGSTTEYFKCVTATPDGGFVAAGRFRAADGDFASLALTSYSPVFAKFDASGKIEWSNVFTGNGADAVNAVATDAAGNIYGACQIISSDGDGKGNHGSADIGIIKLSPSGSKLWVKMFGGSKSDIVNDIYAGASGCVFAGSYTSRDGDFTLNRGGKDAFIGYCDVDGNLKWIRTYGGLKNDTFNAVAPTKFGYAAVGSSDSENRDFETVGNKGKVDAFIMSINFAGTLKHVKDIAGTDNESANSICRLDEQTYIVGGETYSPNGHFSSFGTKKAAGWYGKYYIR